MRRLEEQETGQQGLIWAACGRVLLLLAFCVVNRTVAPHMRNISEEEMLAYYRRPRRDSIVPSWLMMTIILFVPLLIFTLPNLISNRFIDLTNALLGWSLAITVNALTTEVLKLMIGRPRPDYFYRCFPDGRITKDLRCTGCLRELIEGRKSFPSGHSSFSFCSLGFLSLWLCGRFGGGWWRWRRMEGRGARALLSAAPMLLAGLIAASRCLDNHHHWQDVAAGALLGLLVAHLCYRRYYHPLTSPSVSVRMTSSLTTLSSDDIISDYLLRSGIYSDLCQ